MLSATSSAASGNAQRGGGSGIGPQFQSTNTKKQNQTAGMMNLVDPGNTFMGIWNKQKEQEYDPYWAYTPEQKALHQQLGPYLTKALSNTQNGELNLYSGDYTAPLTQGEQDVISQNARMSALGEQGLTNLLKGEFPESYYQDTIYNPALKQFQQDVQPQLEEQYAGNGGYWGSARAGAVAKGYQDLGDTLAAKRAELAWNVQQNIPNAINAANALSTTGAAIQSTPRLIQQYGLDQEYKEWTRGNEANQKYIDQAINFMGLSSGVMDIGNSNIPEGSSIDLGGIANMISAFKGGSSGGTTVNNTTTNPNQTYIDQIDAGTYVPGSYSNSLNSNPTSNSYDTYNSNALNGMDWRNTGNYSRLGGYNY